jgi:hypothetical protein
MGAAAAPIAIIASGLISAGSTYYSMKKQEDAREEAAREADIAKAEEEARQKAIFENTKPSEASATFAFGDDDGPSELGTYSEFITQVKPQTTVSSLGFGTLGGMV